MEGLFTFSSAGLMDVFGQMRWRDEEKWEDVN